MAVAERSTQAPQDLTLNVGGMNCASCVAHVDKAIRSLPGVESSSVNLARGMASIRFNPAEVQPEQIAAAVTSAGYPSAPDSPTGTAASAEEQRLTAQRAHARAWFRRAMIGIVLWLPIELMHWILSLAGRGHAHGGATLWMAWL